MNINETSSYKKTERLLFRQFCLKRSLSYVEFQVGFALTFVVLFSLLKSVNH